MLRPAPTLMLMSMLSVALAPATADAVLGSSLGAAASPNSALSVSAGSVLLRPELARSWLPAGLLLFAPGRPLRPDALLSSEESVPSVPLL